MLPPPPLSVGFLDLYRNLIFKQSDTKDNNKNNFYEEKNWFFIASLKSKFMN
jgi:hypothetical protein